LPTRGRAHGRTTTASEILHVKIKDRYVVGEKIGVWPIFGLSEDEIVAGRNNKQPLQRRALIKRTAAACSKTCIDDTNAGRGDPNRC
jgi:hypothetical protein